MWRSGMFGLSADIVKFYDCHGEVWMDESGIILRISASHRPFRTVRLTGGE